MHISSSYLITRKGDFRCQFFLLLKDYLQAQSQFVQELDLALERFARDMKDSGVLVRPFPGDIENTRAQVLARAWSEGERREIEKTPALLMIDVDFVGFDPRAHRWLHLYFPEHQADGVPVAHDTLAKLATAVCNAEIDVFRAANQIIHQIRLGDAAKVFQAKPGMFGFSVDLVRGGEFVARLYRKIMSRERV